MQAFLLIQRNISINFFVINFDFIYVSISNKFLKKIKNILCFNCHIECYYKINVYILPLIMIFIIIKLNCTCYLFLNLKPGSNAFNI